MTAGSRVQEVGTHAVLQDLVLAAMSRMAVAPSSQDRLLQKPPAAAPSLRVRPLRAELVARAYVQRLMLAVRCRT